VTNGEVGADSGGGLLGSWWNWTSRLLKVKLSLVFAEEGNMNRWLKITIIALGYSGAVQAGNVLSLDIDWNKKANSHALGQATGIGIDSHNHIFIFHRADRIWSDPMPENPIGKNTIIMLDGKTGKRLTEWGADSFIMPHGLSIDNDDNVWLTDVGGHTVQKFNHEGILLLTLGSRGRPGDDASHFNMPADVDFSKHGEIFVADGYENTRVIKFSKNGNYLMQWGKPGIEPGELNLPHGIAVSDNGHVYVADRANSRMQVFTDKGKLIRVIGREIVGRPYGIAVSPEGNIWVIDGGDQPDETRTIVRQLSDEYKQINTINTNRDNSPKVLGHDIAVAQDGAVYVVDAWANRVLKLN